jgi:hypothetical protein
MVLGTVCFKFSKSFSFVNLQSADNICTTLIVFTIKAANITTNLEQRRGIGGIRGRAAAAMQGRAARRGQGWQGSGRGGGNEGRTRGGGGLATEPGRSGHGAEEEGQTGCSGRPAGGEGEGLGWAAEAWVGPAASAVGAGGGWLEGQRAGGGAGRVWEEEGGTGASVRSCQSPGRIDRLDLAKVTLPCGGLCRAAEGLCRAENTLPCAKCTLPCGQVFAVRNCGFAVRQDSLPCANARQRFFYVFILIINNIHFYIYITLNLFFQYVYHLIKYVSCFQFQKKFSMHFKYFS